MEKDPSAAGVAQPSASMIETASNLTIALWLLPLPPPQQSLLQHPFAIADAAGVAAAVALAAAVTVIAIMPHTHAADD